MRGHARTSRGPVWLFVAALVVAVAAACSGGTDEAPYTLESASGPGRFGVGVTTIELVDDTRPTEPNGDVPGRPERALTVEVWYPAPAGSPSPEARDAPLDRADGPYPLVLFAHGLSGVRRQSASFAQHLASHGYVVASPDFPLSNLATPGGPRLAGVIEQPKDLSFVADALIARSSTAGDALEGAVDPEALAVSGHSLGGLTTLLTIYGPSRDARMKAALALSPPACFLTPDVVGEDATPLLVMGGSLDRIVDPASIRRGYDVARPPRYFVDLVGGNHIGFADLDIDEQVAAEALASGRVAGQIVDDAVAVAQAIGGSVTSCIDRTPPPADPAMPGERQRELLRTVGLAFLDAYVRGDENARRFLEHELPALASDARFEYDAD